MRDMTVVELDIGRGQSLSDIEALETVAASNGQRFRVRLARRVDQNFFVESRVASLLAGLGQRGRLEVVDWGSPAATPETLIRFRSSPEGVAAVVYSAAIVCDGKARLQINTSDVVQKIIDQGGFAETSVDRALQGDHVQSISIFAFDDEDPIPLSLNGADVYARFKDKFRRIRSRYFEVGVGDGYSATFSDKVDEHLIRFIFELYQNTFRHGRFSKAGARILPGLRFIRMKRHIAATEIDLVRRAEGFPELQDYLSASVKSHPNKLFYEVTISDTGIGITDRFLATATPLQRIQVNAASKRDVINKIIEKALSSNSTIAGAGNGLRNAVRDVDSLKGFLSVRCNDNWMYRNGARLEAAPLPNDPLERALTPVERSSPLACSCGTQINMLFPVSG